MAREPRLALLGFVAEVLRETNEIIRFLQIVAPIVHQAHFEESSECKGC